MGTLLMVIDGYSIGGYFVIAYWLFQMVINVIILVVIGGYYINGYCWLFY